MAAVGETERAEAAAATAGGVGETERAEAAATTAGGVGETKRAGAATTTAGSVREKKRSTWSKSEDEVLREQVRMHGDQNWGRISLALDGRSSKSCRLRWMQHLAPELDNRRFTAEEDATIVACQREHGNKWATIASYLPGRSDNAVKNRWNTVLRKRAPVGGSGEQLLSKRPRVGGEADSGEDSSSVESSAANDLPVCLEFLPLVPGDVKKSAMDAPADVDYGIGDPMTVLTIGPSIVVVDAVPLRVIRL